MEKNEFASANDNAADRKVVDLGTRERARQRGGLKVAARMQTEGGVVLHQGAAATMECVLDALRDTGLLDGSEGTKADRVAVGRSRYDQGAWLRQLYFRAGLNTVHAHDVSVLSGSGQGRGYDLSDEAANARLKYNRTMRDLGSFADAVAAFVCFDEIRRGEPHLKFLRKGLDRLCVLRG